MPFPVPDIPTPLTVLLPVRYSEVWSSPLHHISNDENPNESYMMFTEEAFNRHPRPQAAIVPTHSALALQKTKATGRPRENKCMERSTLKVDVPAETSKKRPLPSPSPIGPIKPIKIIDSPPTSPPIAHLASKTIVRRISPERTQSHASSIITRPGCVSDRDAASLRAQDGLPWERFTRLGTIVQGPSELAIGMEKDNSQRMVMVKTLNRRDGLKEAEQLRKLSHPNIVQLLDVFFRGDEVCIGLEYCRFTLEEIVNVHIRLEEPHLRLIAHSVL